MWLTKFWPVVRFLCSQVTLASFSRKLDLCRTYVCCYEILTPNLTHTKKLEWQIGVFGRAPFQLNSAPSQNFSPPAKSGTTQKFFGARLAPDPRRGILITTPRYPCYVVHFTLALGWNWTSHTDEPNTLVQQLFGIHVNGSHIYMAVWHPSHETNDLEHA